jgi:hypothetical protein
MSAPKIRYPIVCIRVTPLKGNYEVDESSTGQDFTRTRRSFFGLCPLSYSLQSVSASRFYHNKEHLELRKCF